MFYTERAPQEWESKQEIENRYHNNLSGNAIGLAALMGIDVEEVPAIFNHLQEEVEQTLKTDPEAIYEKYNRASERFAQLP